MALTADLLQSTGSDSSVCTFKVCKSGSDICQLRLGFDTFVASQPSTVQGWGLAFKHQHL